MPDFTLISQAIDFIEDNLKEPISVADMAEAATYSLYHFCRLFNQVTHHTPYDYLMRRRLSEAARALLESQDKIIDIALDYQFNNPETFSRAFQRFFGTQPSRLRKQGDIDSRRLMPRLSLAHIQHIHKGTYLKAVLEEKEPFQVAGVMTLVRDDLAVISDAWDWLVREVQRAVPVLEVGDYYGIAFYPHDLQPPSYVYMAAVEIRTLDLSHTALVTKRIPALTYARFTHKGGRYELPLSLNYIYHTWLPKSGRRLSYAWVVEHHGRQVRHAEGEASEMTIYIPVSSQSTRP
jgi:AraC family transcriptional regulator